MLQKIIILRVYIYIYTRKIIIIIIIIHLMRINDTILIAVESNAMRKDYMKAKIDYTHLSSNCWLLGEKDETINYIIDEGSKVAQK